MASTAVAERPAARPAAAPARPARTSGPPGPTAAPTPGSITAGPRPTDGAAPRVRLAAVPSAEEVSLKGSGTFAPPQPVVDYLTGQRRGGDVAVRFPGIAAGLIHVQKHGDKYRTPDTPQAIAIDHPALNPLREVQLPPMLVVRVHDNVVTGYVTVAAGTKLVPSPQALVAQIKRHSAALGLIGMGELQIPPIENKLEGGALSLKTDLAFKLGGFLNGKGSFGLTDDVVTFAAHADASVKGVANLAVDLERHPDGVIAGRAEIPVQLKNFSGNFLLVFAGGLVDVTGTFKYTTEKLSGEVTLLITDAQTARTVAYQHLPPEAIDASARQAAGGSAVAAAPTSAGPKPGPRAVAGWGTLDVHYSEWLTGKALVVVDSQGHVTVTGKIAPPAKVEFKQTQLDFEKQIFKFEVRASYGLPYVGDVFLFAGVGLFAIAKISPLTISKIEIVGTYSTDPAIFNSFSLSANINISALAGLKLRAEGGLGIEILSHDIKIGAAVLATAGIRAYVDATPVIGYRELADPTAGRRGEFYIHGEAEIAAQPFLALGGELFVKLETPWWSPVSDHTWTWPLGELIYPLPGEIGVGVDVDYIFGSGKLPTISPKAVDFNSDRFMSDLMDDKVGHGGAEDVKKPGKWNERLQAPPPPPAPPKLKDSKGPAKKRDDKPTKDKAKTWAGGMAALGQLKKRGDTQPYGAAEIDAALKALKTQYGFSVLQAKAVGDQWEIAASLGKDTLKKPLRIKRAPGSALSPGLAGAKDGQASDTEPLLFGKEKHQLHGYLEHGRVRFTIASDENDIEATMVRLRTTYVTPWRQHEATKQAGDALEADLQKIEKRADQLIKGILSARPERQQALMHSALITLRGMIADTAKKHGLQGFAWIQPKVTAPHFSPRSHGRAGRVEATLSIYSYTRGTETARGTALPGLALIKGYQQGHLVARALGGSGTEPLNLTPLDRVSNTEMRDYAERCARENLDARHPETPTFDPTNVIRYVVICEPPRQGGDPAALAAWLRDHHMPVTVPGAERLFTAAENNTVTQAALSGAAGMPLTPQTYESLRRALAYFFLARVVRINMEVLQGKAKVGPSYPVDNHRSDPLP